MRGSGIGGATGTSSEGVAPLLSFVLRRDRAISCLRGAGFVSFDAGGKPQLHVFGFSFAKNAGPEQIAIDVPCPPLTHPLRVPCALFHNLVLFLAPAPAPPCSSPPLSSPAMEGPAYAHGRSWPSRPQPDLVSGLTHTALGSRSTRPQSEQRTDRDRTPLFPDLPGHLRGLLSTTGKTMKYLCPRWCRALPSLRARP